MQRRATIETTALRAAAKGAPQHCGSAEQSCRGHDLLSVKQQRQIEHLAGMTSSAVPKGIAEMTPGQADRWLARHWELWRQMGHPLH